MSSPRDRRLRPDPVSLTPHSNDLEQAILGGIIVADVSRKDRTTNDGLERVLNEGLRPEHFYQQIHGRIFELMMQLGREAKPITIFSLKAFIEDVDLGDGMTPSKYIAMLAGAAVTLINMPDYARMVVQLAQRRALIGEAAEFQNEVARAAPDRTNEELAAYAIQRIQALAENSPGVVTRKTIGDAAAEMLTRARLRKENGPEGNVVPTGFVDLDRMTGGFEEGTLWVAGGRPGMGKGQRLDDVVPTPFGMKRWGDLAPGDMVFGRDGTPTTVVGTFPLGVERIFRVWFDDRSFLDVTGDHLWNVQRKDARLREGEFETKTTADLIRDGVRGGSDSRRLYSIPQQGAVEFLTRHQPVPPYLLGVWLGDGTVGEPCWSKPDPEIVERVRSLGYQVCDRADGITKYVYGVKDSFRSLEVFRLDSHDRFVPEIYRCAGVSARRDILAGLLDTDGEVYQSGTIGFSSTSRRLIDDVVWLARSLGCKAMVQPTVKQPSYRGPDGEKIAGRPCWRVTIAAAFNPFSVARKRDRFKLTEARYLTRYIDRIEEVAPAAAMCIKVAAPDELYQANGFIVTHNTSLMVSCGNAIGRMSVRRERDGEPGWGVMEFSLEVPQDQFMARHVADLVRSSRRTIPFGNIMRGELEDDELWIVEDGVRRFDDMPIIVDFAPKLSVADIALRVRTEKARFARQGVQLRVVFIDYLKFIKASDRYRGQRVYEVGEITGALKALAKQERVCIVLLCQLNRANEARDDKRPGLADLRESGDIESDADVVVFLHREAYYIEKSAKFRENDSDTLARHAELVHQAELIVAKNRAGPTRTVLVYCNIAASSLGNLREA